MLWKVPSGAYGWIMLQRLKLRLIFEKQVLANPG
jgi:hypothetical protein